LTCTAAQPLSASAKAAPKPAAITKWKQRFPGYEKASELNLLMACLLSDCCNNKIQPFVQQHHSSSLRWSAWNRRQKTPSIAVRWKREVDPAPRCEALHGFDSETTGKSCAFYYSKVKLLKITGSVARE
jgi:hypothetical protein